MKNDNAHIEKLIKYLVESSDKDFITMNNLFKSKDYNWSLFIGHLVIEKLLKALICKENKVFAPFTHDLRRLSKLLNIEFLPKQLEALDTITTFNIVTRYDNYKQSFYKKCNREFA